ncbi:protein FAR1-RELATED SEQUENCE 5-like [Rhizophagus irregularis DAOM 181602=DAOM 197198]|uniref:MULE transposase domain-containing protein n=1 Tax=Rhizophagus irregularis (strain DAOM 197198w) TaxID=1432141 RepID=A0A015J8M7_RHIIW|nr:hypothetical protein RirG_154280 [Rhizophagus irregularis DAOM 197198w]GET60111.1 protein FAR1-RELATED SEQUENCE 5-like [Rhizophagus irregularis DAOM 181602=DAOM 197198]CAB4469564.1 unnamed protein product [Rhizophagus irregularis]
MPSVNFDANQHQTQIVAQAIVDDETQLSYEWVFQCVKEVTGMLPKVFVTDGDPAINAVVTIQFLNTFHMHCIWHISQNLPKQLKGKLSSNFDDFMKDFYKARNSLREEQFNEKWNALLQNYLQSKDYLTKVLGCNPQSWARTFTNRYFTASIQTTSRNEGENSTLKWLFGDSNTCPFYNAQLLIDFIGYVTLFNTFKASTYKANITFKAIDCFEQVNTDYL